LKLGRGARTQLTNLIGEATGLRGDFFRSVAFRYFHPDDVISGEGTWLAGGRFVPVGVRAVYASLEEETALREVTARKLALGGRKQVELRERPGIRGGRPSIAGTGVSVRRIAQWHNMGQTPEEIVRTLGGHLSLAQVHAALAYYYANQGEIGADLEEEVRATEALERQHAR